MVFTLIAALRVERTDTLNTRCEVLKNLGFQVLTQ